MRIVPHLFAALLAASAAGAASAQTPAPDVPGMIDELAAREIAWRHGLSTVEEIARNGHVWELAGRDRRGVEIALDIDAHDGSVLR